MSFRSRSRCSPFAQPAVIANGVGGTGGAFKPYKIQVPVYAGGPKATQEDWNNITHTFAITDPSGKRKEYEVLHNMATPRGSMFKLYPNTGVEKDGSTYFPVNQWGFAISPRNLKQYNWNMVMDSMLWSNYTVTGCAVEFAPNQGALQAGSLEIALLTNAQEMPPIPYTGSGINSVALTATQKSGKSFVIQNQTNPYKEMKSIQEQFDAVADYGILWTRCAGFHFQNASEDAIVEVGSLTILITIGLVNPSASAHAQLIGAWVEAGYPIKPEDGRETSTRQVSSVGSAMFTFEITNAEVSKDAIKRGKSAHPRWYKVPVEGEKTIKALCGPAEVRSLNTPRRSNKDEIAMPFPEIAQSDFDGGIRGNTVLKASQEGATVKDGFAVVKPQDGGNWFVPYSETLYIDANPEVTPALGKEENGSRVNLAFYPSTSAPNGSALASGDIEVPFDGSQVGKKVGVTVKTITSFPVGTKPLEEGTADCTVTLGWEPGIGNTTDVSREFIPEDADGNSFSEALACSIAAAAGAFVKNVSNGKSNSEVDTTGVNALATDGTAGSKSVPFQGTNANGVDASIEIQSVGLVCPENASYRTKMGELSAIEKSIAEVFFGEFPLCAKYGVRSFNPSKLSNDIARLTVTGQLNTLHTALLSTYGPALPSTSGLSYSTESQEVMYLVGSRIDPAVNPEGFYNTAIPLTPTADSKTGSATTGPMYVQNAGSGANGFFTVDKITNTGKQLRVGNNPVGAIALSQLVSNSVCNFTIAWPDKLIDPDSKELTEFKAGETMYVAFLKSTAVTYSHPIVEGTGTYRFCVFPDLLPGTDKSEPSQALHKYELTLGAGSDPITTYSAVSQGAAFEKTVYMMEDGERRFSIQNTTPVEDGGNANKAKGWLKLKRTY